MKNFIVVACVWSLLVSGIAAGNAGGVAVVKRKVVNIAAAALLGVGAVCGAFTGCDRAGQMGSRMVREVDPVEQAVDGEELPAYNLHRTIKFGVIYEHEFPQSFLGAVAAVRILIQMNMNNGIEGLAFEPVPIRIYDNSWSSVVRAASNLIEYDQVVAIIGPNSSLLAEFSDEVAQTSGVPMLAIGSTSPGVPRAGDMVFLTAFSDTYQGQVLAAFARDDLSADSAAVLFRSDSNYSEDIAQSFKDGFRAAGGVVSSYHGYTYAEGNDALLISQLRRVVEEIARSQPDVVAIPSFVADAAVVTRELRKAGVEAIFIGSDSWSGGLVDSMDERNLISVAGAAVEGAYYPTHFFAEASEGNLSRESAVFVQAYRQMFDWEPDALAALGYDAAMIVQQAATRIGADKLTPQALRDEIEKIQGYRGATDVAGYDISRLPNKNVIILTVKNGTEMFHKNIRP